MCYQCMDSYTEVYIIQLMRCTWNSGQVNKELYECTLIIWKHWLFHQWFFFFLKLLKNMFCIMYSFFYANIHRNKIIAWRQPDTWHKTCTNKSICDTSQCKSFYSMWYLPAAWDSCCTESAQHSHCHVDSPW